MIPIVDAPLTCVGAAPTRVQLVDLQMEAEAARLTARRVHGAERVAALLQLAASRLSLRDPLAPRGGAMRASGSPNGRALPCNFTEGRPSLRLGCPGHLSWTTRDEPRYERNCRRVGALAQVHDSALMR